MKPKMATVKPLKRKCLENEAKMHFTCTMAVLAGLSTFKPPPQRTLTVFFFCTSSSTQQSNFKYFVQVMGLHISWSSSSLDKVSTKQNINSY